MFAGLWIALSVYGGILCFFGYRLFRCLLAVLGFFLGAAIGGVATQGPEGILFGAIIGAFLLGKFYDLAVFVIGFVTAVVLCMAFSAYQGDSSLFGQAYFIVGIFGGLIACILDKVWIVVITAVSGSLMFSLAMMPFLPGDSEMMGRSSGIRDGMFGDEVAMLALLLAVLGAFFQFSALSKKKDVSDVSVTSDSKSSS